MSFLLDTMVVSELAKHHRDRSLAAWLAGQDRRALHLSVVTLGEIEKGLALLRRRDNERADALAGWLDELVGRFRDRLLDVDARIARRWGRLAASAGHAGADLLIAATALEHDLTVVTRNVRHFAATGVRLVDPYGAFG